MSFAGMEDGQTIVYELAGGRQAILEYSAVVFVCCQSAAQLSTAEAVTRNFLLPTAY